MTVKCFFDRRITPAHTGKTYLILHLCLFPDHPRSHGENFLKSGSLARMRGSPPRMRGKPDAKLSQVPTPAHAGKTGCQTFASSGCRDHPRACGENSGHPSSNGAEIKDHPRTHGENLKTCVSYGITPARTGKTASRARRRRSRRDHPRTHGENTICCLHLRKHETISCTMG